MQTFLPYADFYKSLSILDNKRLGKQRIETYQILMINLEISINSWKNHPAVKMWKGYEDALISYGILNCIIWRRKGFKDSLLDKFLFLFKLPEFKYPYWFGNSNFHLSHQSNLIRKKPEYYSQFFSVPNNLPYYWPTKEN